MNVEGGRAAAARRVPLAVSLLAVSVLAGVGAARPCAAQDSPPPAGAGAAPFLEPDHWALDALLRLDGLGLLDDDGYDPAAGGVTRAEAHRLLEHARQRADRTAPQAHALLAAYYSDRFLGEFPAAAQAAREDAADWQTGRLRAGGGWSDRRRELATTVGTPRQIDTPAEMVRGESGPAGTLDLSGYWTDALAVRGVLRADPGGARLEETYIGWAPGPVDVWVGRRRLRTSYEESAILSSGESAVSGAGVRSEPFELPWLLGGLGRVRLSTSLGRLDHVEPYSAPWLWLFRASVRPHPRFTLGLNRAAMAVGVDGGLADRLRQVAYIAIGKHGATNEENWRDNQMASVDVRYRPPVESVLPLTFYLEWGLDDSAGSWRSVPGIVGGVTVAAVPGAPWLGVGLERSHFAERCCGNIWWYRHTGFLGGWTDARRPLGHPLGGHGDEWALRLDGVFLGGRLVVDGAVHARERREENLYAPTFRGGSVGGSMDASLRLRRHLELVAGGAYEESETGWSAFAGGIGAAVLF